MRLPSVGMVIALAATTFAVAGPAEATGTERLYLTTSADDESSWYTTDLADPELGGDWSCTYDPSGSASNEGCRGGLGPDGFSFFAAFLPRVLFQDHVTWNGATPLRYRLEVDADAPRGITVQLGLQHGGALVESQPATEVSPGVFEGLMPNGAPFDPSLVKPITVRVSSPGPVRHITIDGDGGSWIDVPTDSDIVSVPELLENEPAPADPSTLVTGERTFSFNDADWTHASYTGILHPATTHGFVNPRPAVALLVWLEGFSDPVGSKLLRGDDVDGREVLQFPELRVFRGGQVVAARERTLAMMDVPAGPLSIEVSASALIGSLRGTTAGLPFTLHVVAIHGERTLQKMEWAVPPARWNTFRTPFVASCPWADEAIPQSPAVATFKVDLETFAATPGQRWTLGFELPGVGAFPCGEAGTGSSLRLTLAGSRLWYIGPTPHPDSTFHSAQDVHYVMTATFTHTN